MMIIGLVVLLGVLILHMSSKTCHICYKELPLYIHNRQIYCSDKCIAIGKQTTTRILKQRYNFNSPRKCKRCLIFKSELGMKAHCKECLDVIKETEVKKCMQCKVENVKTKSKYCSTCAKERHKEQIRVSNEKQKKFRKPCRGCGDKLPEGLNPKARYCSDDCKNVKVVKVVKEVTEIIEKPKKELNSYWLSRGKIK
jgi:hypothetical protein